MHGTIPMTKFWVHENTEEKTYEVWPQGEYKLKVEQMSAADLVKWVAEAVGVEGTLEIVERSGPVDLTPAQADALETQLDADRHGEEEEYA